MRGNTKGAKQDIYVGLPQNESTATVVILSCRHQSLRFFRKTAELEFCDPCGRSWARNRRLSARVRVSISKMFFFLPSFLWQIYAKLEAQVSPLTWYELCFRTQADMSCTSTGARLGRCPPPPPPLSRRRCVD